MSRKNTQSKKLATRNEAQTPRPTWRNNFMKQRPDDAPYSAVCRQKKADAEENAGRYYWIDTEGIGADKQLTYFRWDDEVGDHERVDGDSATQSLKSSPARPPKKVVSKKIIKNTKAASPADEDEATVNEVDVEMLERVVSKLCTWQSKTVDLIEDLRMENTKAFLRINELEEQVASIKKYGAVPVSKAIVVPKPTEKDLALPLVTKPKSLSFQEVLKQSRDLAIARNDRIAKEAKEKKILGKFLMSEHQKQNQEEITITNEPLKKKTKLDLTLESPPNLSIDLIQDDESTDLLEEAMMEIAKIQQQQQQQSEKTSVFKEKPSKTSTSKNNEDAGASGEKKQ